MFSTPASVDSDSLATLFALHVSQEMRRHRVWVGSDSGSRDEGSWHHRMGARHGYLVAACP